MRKSYLYIWGLVALLLVVGKVGQAQDSLGMYHVATLDYWQGAYDIQMVGNLAYIVSGGSGLRIVDLTDPANPVEIGRGTWYDWSSPFGGVYVIGNRAYVATIYGCSAFDISDPTQPVEIARWWEDRTQYDIFVHDTIAIIQMDDESLVERPVVADISDLENVQQIGDFGYRCLWPIGMAQDYLYMANPEGGMLVFDISTPSQPMEVAQVDTMMSAGNGIIAGDYIYLGTAGYGVRIIDISSPLQPIEVASCDSGECGAGSVTEGHLVICKYDYLDIWNVADPLHPVLEGVFPFPASFAAVAGSGNLICLGYWNNPLSVAVVDISNPAAPIQVSSFGLVGSLGFMKTNGTTGYLAGAAFPGSEGAGLCIINLTNPANPIFLGIIHGYGSDVAINGNYLYSTHRNSGLVVFDISNPTEPESLHCTPGGCPQKIVIVGDYAYVVETDQGTWVSLFTYSLLEPAEPVRVDSLHIPYYTMGDAFGVQNGYLYIGASYSSAYLFVYSLANPGVPQLVGTANWSNVYGCVPIDLELTDHYAYVADYAGGLATINITQPENPVVIAQIQGPTICEVAAIGDTIVTDGNSRINMWNMTDPTNPLIIAYYPTLEMMRDIKVLGSNIITLSSSEYRVYQCDTLANVVAPHKSFPAKFNLLPPYPNPFNNILTIPFTIPVQKEVIINIYNILGQKVQQFTLQNLSPGAHRILWNSGSCASGLYFIHLISGGKEFRQNVVLLK
jgi:hypothetical protein